jgi:two-component system, LytTR family, response regulator
VTEAARRWRVVIVDDEPLAREGIRLLLGDDPELEITAECANGAEAVATVRLHQPDLVFLDVQMPEMGGFEALAALGAELPPAVIFVTAFDRYALRAFEVHALDYLLKPFTDDRFFDAVARAKQQLGLAQVSELSTKLRSLLESQAPAPPPAGFLSRLAVRDVGRVVFLDVAEVDWIEAADYYVQLHVGSQSYLHRETMNRIEQQLDPARFLRIHRSAIVNRDRVKELRSHGREVIVVLAGGAELPVARRHREKLQRLR